MNNCIWLIAAQADMLSGLITNMNAMPESYQASNSQTEWASWLKLNIAISLDRIFYAQVYTEVLNKIIGYNYDNARIAEVYAPPSCTVVGSNIECDEDPTGESRTPLLWRRVSGKFTEQATTGMLDAETWTFSSVPAASFYVIAWSDNFQSLPTIYLTVN
jgi:hypothetical protein